MALSPAQLAQRRDAATRHGATSERHMFDRSDVNARVRAAQASLDA